MALETLCDSPGSFPLDLLIADCGKAHGPLLWEHWQRKREVLGLRFATGVALFMETVDSLASYEARFWSHTTAESDRTLFARIVHQTTTLHGALGRCHAMGGLSSEAQESVYRALGHRYGKAVLALEDAPVGLIMGMLERESFDSMPAALTQALSLQDGARLPQLVSMLWDRDDEALRAAIEAVENGHFKRPLATAFFTEALNQVDPSEILSVWDYCRRLAGQRPLSEEAFREATNDNDLLSFPILVIDFNEGSGINEGRGIYSRALDYAARCSRAAGERLLASDRVNMEAKLGLRIRLHEGDVEDLVAELDMDPLGTAQGLPLSRAAIMDWARVNPYEALALAERQEDPASRDFALGGIGASPIGAMLPEIGKQAIFSIDDPNSRENALRNWAAWLAQENPHDGSRILAEIHSEQGLPDEAIAEFVQRTAAVDLDGAMVWLDEIRNDVLREKVLAYLEGARLKQR